MEGDVLTAGMAGFGAPVSLVVASCAAVLGGVFALLRWFAARLLSDFEEKLQRIDEIDHRVSQRMDDLEGRIERILAELPIHYQRRDDAIREYTAINAKLDRMYEVIVEVRRGG